MIRRFSAWRFHATVKRLQRCSPREPLGQPLDFVLLSALCHRDVYAYIAAVLSLQRWLIPRRQVVVDDGSLLPKDMETLERYFPGIEYVAAGIYTDPGLPTYSSWRRIQAIAEFSASSYVMQLDADTLFFADPAEVQTLIKAGKSFMLGTDEGEVLVSAAEAQSAARVWHKQGERHIQCLCESNLEAFPEFFYMHYVRACAGFSGFSRGSVSMEKLREISSVYRTVLNDRWGCWGSEQVASNIILANTPGVEVLPLSRYDEVGNYSSDLVFCHFIGSSRFINGIYTRCARKLLEAQGLITTNK